MENISSRHSACAHNCTRSTSSSLPLPRLNSTGIASATPPPGARYNSTRSHFPINPRSSDRIAIPNSCRNSRRDSWCSTSTRSWSTFPSAVKKFSFQICSICINAYCRSQKRTCWSAEIGIRSSSLYKAILFGKTRLPRAGQEIPARAVSRCRRASWGAHLCIRG